MLTQQFQFSENHTNSDLVNIILSFFLAPPNPGARGHMPPLPPPHYATVGKEFYNKHIDFWITDNNIIRYSTHGEHKLAIVERFNRTLKTNMWKRFTAENTRNWINMLDKLMNKYNNTVHSTIKMTPVEASQPENKNKVLNNHGFQNDRQLKPKFEAGDRVRISRTKAVFEKGYLPNWSEAIYEITEVKYTNPFTYNLKDMNGEPIDGSFYGDELQKTNQEVYRIEKIIRKKKINGIEHGLVKWLGYNNKFNEWKPMSEIEKLT